MYILDAKEAQVKALSGTKTARTDAIAKTLDLPRRTFP